MFPNPNVAEIKITHFVYHNVGRLNHKFTMINGNRDIAEQHSICEALTFPITVSEIFHFFIFGIISLPKTFCDLFTIASFQVTPLYRT